MNALNRNQGYFRPTSQKQYTTQDVNQLITGPISGAPRGCNKIVDIYQFYTSARQQFAQKENTNNNIPRTTHTVNNLADPSITKSATTSTTNFYKEDLIIRIKKLNQIRQKSQQSVQPVQKKYVAVQQPIKNQITEEKISHQRYRSTIHQKTTKESQVSFHQLLQKTTERSNLIERYENKQNIISDEQLSLMDLKSQPVRSAIPPVELIKPHKTKKTSSQNSNMNKENLSNQQNQGHTSKVTTAKPIDYLSKIVNIAGLLQKSDNQTKGNYFLNQCDRSQISQQASVNEVKKSLDNMCRLSSQQLDLMHETRNDLTFAKTIKSDYNSAETQAQTMALDLTCDEEIKIDCIEPAEVEIEINQDDPSLDIPGNYSQETLKFLVLREREYLPDPHYLNKEQVNLTWQMRAILIDWMMDVSCEFHFRRETFHLAVAYLDSYLSKSQKIPKIKLQLVGLTTMFVAAKIEEIFPRKVQDFARAADYGYQVEEILEMELKILCSSKWMVNPPTVNLWTNWYLCQWDLYTAKHPSQVQCYFKKATEESYQLFCQVIQLIDCSVLEVQFIQYLPRTIIASFMYLTISVAQGVFDKKDIKNIKHSSLFLLDQANQFNIYFGQFVSFSFGFNLIDLLPAIQFASTFFSLEICYDTPAGVQSLANTPLEGHYEEFLSFQMYSRELLTFVKERKRDEQ